MKALHRPAALAAAAGLLVLAAGAASAQQRQPIGLRTPPPGHGGHHRGGNIRGLPYYIVEREVVRVIEREVVRDDPPAPPAPAAPPEPRKPYVIGDSYASLPGGCMKLIEDGASYYYCGGEWYRQAGRHYEAVARP